MTIIIFIIMLAVLILSHELGHFLAAKWSGIRVDEFGLGFPPRAVALKRGETEYSLNWIPFGGFVKIFGENPDEENMTGPDSARSMVNKPKWIQAIVLAAGVFFNVVLAWILISLGFMIGLPTPASEAQNLGEAGPAKLLITNVMPGSPAEEAGLKAGDEIVTLNGTPALSVEDVQNFVSSRAGQETMIGYHRGQIFGEEELPLERVTVIPKAGLVEPGKAAIGVGMDMVAIVQTPLHTALWEGLKLTVTLVYATAKAILGFIVDAFRGEGALSQVTGPVGLVGLVGDARTLGFVYLLSFMAIISINLAVINLIPFPALDGGRLLFLGIEKVRGKAIKPETANRLNLVGFALLLLLMVVVTYKDILNLFR